MMGKEVKELNESNNSRGASITNQINAPTLQLPARVSSSGVRQATQDAGPGHLQEPKPKAEFG